MGKITGSWLLKVHEHAGEDATEADLEAHTPPTIDELKAAVTTGLNAQFGGEWTVSLAERTDD